MIKEYTISELTHIILGGTPKTSINEYWDGNIKWVTAKDVSNCYGRYIYNTEKYISQQGVENSAAKIMGKDTIIITSRGTVGKVVLLSEDMSFNQTCYGLISKSSLLRQKFLYYYLKTISEIINSYSYGSVFDTITKKTFDHLKIKIPTLDVQDFIISMLSSLDDKIELNTQMNATLEAIGQALFKRWFVDFEFPDENGTPYRSSGGEMEDSKLGPIPKGWKVKSLDKLSNNYDSKRIPISSRKRAEIDKIYPYYGATGIIDYVDDYIFDGTYLLMAEDGSVIDEKGYPILQYVTGKFWVNNHTHVIQGKNNISTEFLYFSLKNTIISPYVTGAVQLKINQKNMNKIKLIIPGNHIMNVFQKLIINIFSYFKTNENEIDVSSKLRDALLPKLMSGELRVPLEEGSG
jgi:type I restriction enzyme S subunit